MMKFLMVMNAETMPVTVPMVRMGNIMKTVSVAIRKPRRQ